LLGLAFRSLLRLLSDILNAIWDDVDDTDCDHLSKLCDASSQLAAITSWLGFGGCFLLLRLEEAASVADASAACSQPNRIEHIERLRRRGIWLRRIWRIDASAHHIHRHRNRHVWIAFAHGHLRADGELRHLIQNTAYPR
jgi:hypothetical protein